MRIGRREIGPGESPYLIAELGVNHDGDPQRALSLVDAAAGAGADAVKLQFFVAERLMSGAARLAAYQRSAGESDPVEMLARLELSIDEMSAIVERAHTRGMHALVTVFSLELVEEAARLPWDAYKTASPDVINRPLLLELAATGRPMIASTGAADLAEIAVAADWLREVHDRLALLHCVSCYPTPLEWASIPAMEGLRRISRGPVGYSDHTTEVDTGAVAVALGACILEKHLTHSRAAAGPDHAASLEPDQFCEYVRLAQRAHADGIAPDAQDPRLLIREKTVLDVEEDVRTVSRQSVTASRAIHAGDRLRREDLTLKRPGSGLPPRMIDDLVGCMATRDIEADWPVVAHDLEAEVVVAAA